MSKSLLSAAASLVGGPRQSTGARLLERLANATQLDDRRDAIEGFKELASREAIRLVERGGIGVLARLATDEDVQIARDALETLTSLVDPAVPDDAEPSRVAAVHNARVFLGAGPSRVSATFGAVELPDAYVRYWAVQLLMRLLHVAPDDTQAAVLSAPDTVARVMLLMDDRREVVRNEVLLLLEALAKGNADLQNILAFQADAARRPIARARARRGPRAHARSFSRRARSSSSSALSTRRSTTAAPAAARSSRSTACASSACCSQHQPQAAASSSRADTSRVCRRCSPFPTATRVRTHRAPRTPRAAATRADRGRRGRRA